jgi:hypothetical protein
VDIACLLVSAEWQTKGADGNSLEKQRQTSATIPQF